MNSYTAESIKASTARALLTCHCGHSQTSHLRIQRDSSPFGRYLNCFECECSRFRSRLSGIDKRELDKIADEKLLKSQVAAVLINTPRDKHKTTGANSFEPRRAVTRKEKVHRGKERVPSAELVGGASPIYTKIPPKKRKYAWEEAQDGS